MITAQEISLGGKTIEALCVPLLEKNLIVLRGSRGYIMCGYLNMAAADKFNEVAVKITGVASIEDALSARAGEVSLAARAAGITVDMPVKDILPLIV